MLNIQLILCQENRNFPEAGFCVLLSKSGLSLGFKLKEQSLNFGIMEWRIRRQGMHDIT